MRPPYFCQDVSIGCSAGKLEGRISYGGKNQGNEGVILCPPHPLLAGNMENNIITTLAESLASDFTVLTFNYRAVGKSFKPDPDLPLFEYWNRLDEEGTFSTIIDDTREVISWSEKFFRACHLIGYSFGCFIALSALPPSALSYTAITPPLAEHDFGPLQALPCKSLLIFAEKDNLLGHDETLLPAGATIHEISGSDHFFLQREVEVAEIVTSFLKSIHGSGNTDGL